jgi:hypothetical protein
VAECTGLEIQHKKSKKTDKHHILQSQTHFSLSPENALKRPKTPLAGVSDTRYLLAIIRSISPSSISPKSDDPATVRLPE